MARRSYLAGQTEHPPGDTMLRRVFDQAAEESITDEEVERILAPIRRMIMEGKFKKRRRFLPRLPVRVLIAVTAVLLVLLPALTASAWRDSVVEIPDAPIPLAGPVSEGNSLSGRVTLEGAGAEGVWLALADADSMEIAGKAVTDEDGNWSLRGIPDGSYRLTVIPPPGMEAEDGTEAGGWILIDGSAELNLSGNSEREGVEVRICKAGS